MGFWMMALLWVATTVVGELLRPKPKFDTPRPSALGDFTFPTAEAGRAIPAFWGTCHVKGPNVVWYGDLEITAITEKVKTGIFSSKRITTGYKYSLGQQLVIGFGEIDELVEVRFGDKPANYSSSVLGDRLRLDFDDEELFGGEKSEGGVSGAMDFYTGTTTQAGNDYLGAALAQTMPGYRRVCYAVARRMYVGTSQYIKAISFVVRRTPNQLGVTAGKHVISGDANPLCVLYEILTDQFWGIGLASADIDVAAWRSVAADVYDEGLGISLVVDNQIEARALIEDILRHIDGVLVEDPTSGLLRVVLARADYVVGSLPLFNPSNCSEMEHSRPSWEETFNVVRVNYTARDANYQTRTIQHQDLAGVQARGQTLAVESIDFMMFSRPEPANAAAARSIKALAYPLAKVRVKTNRDAWTLTEGSVFRLTWPSQGIADLVLRATQIRRGSLQQGSIEIDAVEDIFSITTTAYTAPPATGWTPPSTDAEAAEEEALFEVPYQLADNGGRLIGTLVARAHGAHTGYQVWADLDGGTDFVLVADIETFTPTGTLESAYDADTAAVDATGLTIENVIDGASLTDSSVADLETGFNLALVGAELVHYEDVTDNGDGTYTLSNVWRGQLDTVPQAHSLGARVWLLGRGAGLVQEDAFAGDVSIRARALPYTPSEVLAIGSASDLLITTASRVTLPYPPADLEINGEYFPSAPVVGTLAITWKGRNRLTATRLAVAQTEAHVAPEAGTGYNLRILRRDTSAVMLSVTGIPAGASGGAYNAQGWATDATNEYTLEVWAARGATPGLQKFIQNFDIYGWSFDYGNDYGGATAGVVAVKEQPPPQIDPVPGVSTTQTITITFGGSFSSSDSLLVRVSLWLTAGGYQSEQYTIAGSGKTSVEDFVGALESELVADFPDHLSVSRAGLVLTISTIYGTPGVTIATNAGGASVRLRQAASGVKVGKRHIASIDAYEVVSGVEQLAPDTGPYADDNVFAFELQNFVIPEAYDAQLSYALDFTRKVLVAGTWDNLPGAVTLASQLQVLAALLQASPALAVTAENISLAWSTGIAPAAGPPSQQGSHTRPSLEITFKPNIRCAPTGKDTYFLAGPGTGPNGAYRLFTKTVQAGTLDHPSGAQQVVTVAFGNIYNTAGARFDGMAVGQVYWVELAGTRVSYTVQASDVSSGVRTNIVTQLKAGIDALALYTTTLAGTPTEQNQLIIRRNTVNASFTYAAGASAGIEFTIVAS